MSTPNPVLNPMKFDLTEQEEADLIRRFLRGDGQWLGSLDAIDDLLRSCQRIQNKFAAADGTVQAHDDIKRNLVRAERRIQKAFAALHLLQEDELNAFYIQVNDPTQRPKP